MTLELPTIEDEPTPQFGVVDIARGIRVVTVRCELDMLTVPTFTQILIQELRLQPHGLIVDLSDCRLLGAHGITALETAHQQTGSRTSLVLAGAPRFVARTLRLSDLDMLIPTYPSIDDAVRALTRGRR